MFHFSNIIEKLAGEAREAGVDLPHHNTKPEDLDNRELVKVRNSFRAIARSVLSKLEGLPATAPESESRALGKLHDLALNGWDILSEEVDLRTIDNSEETRNSQRPPMGGTAMGVDAGGWHSGGYNEDSFAGRVRLTSAGLVPTFRSKDGEEIRVLSSRQALAKPNAWRGPSLGDLVRAMALGPRNDEEARALAEGTGSAGGFTVPEPLSAQFIDRLRAKSVVFQAGALTVPMTSKTLQFARVETDPTMAWRAENAAITESDPTFAAVTLEAKSLAGFTRVSRELMEDSLNIGSILENIFAQAAALEFDRAALFGTGADNQPTGIFNTSGINSVSMGTNGAAFTNYDPLIDLLYEMQLDNAPEPTAMIWHPRTGRDLAKLRTGDGYPLPQPDMVARVPKLDTTSVPITQTQGSASNASAVIAGDFRNLLIGIRSDIRIEVLREPGFENHQFVVVCHMRGDVIPMHKACFAKLIGVIPPA